MSKTLNLQPGYKCVQSFITTLFSEEKAVMPLESRVLTVAEATIKADTFQKQCRYLLCLILCQNLTPSPF